jgi:ABC-type Fe3+ transport system substrate-binding protein
LGLVQFLEHNTAQIFQRIGIVNIGIDSVAYTLASQDSLRSPLFWRLTQALGNAQARIFNTESELLDALEAGDIDFGYNIPLSAIAARKAVETEIDFFFPEDYVLSLPWTLLATRNNAQNRQLAVAHFLAMPENNALLGLNDLSTILDAATFNYQPVPLGPELMVFLDQIKRSRFLDSWFQLATGS